MLASIKRLVWNTFVSIDSTLKFPNLRKGEIGIQLGFDMSAPVTSDLFQMHKRVKPTGYVLGVDPDPNNINKAKEIINKHSLNIVLSQKAVSSMKGECNLLLGESCDWNQIDNIPIDSTVKFSGNSFLVNMDSLDNIIAEFEIDIKKIGHINLTINGAELDALKGMHNILIESKNINLTIIAGRYDESGTINGRADFEIITELLQEYGFTSRFKRIHQFFWWGFIVKTLLNRKRIYGKRNYGVIMASKGNKKLKWYQSFS